MRLDVSKAETICLGLNTPRTTTIGIVIDQLTHTPHSHHDLDKLQQRLGASITLFDGALTLETLKDLAQGRAYMYNHRKTQ